MAEKPGGKKPEPKKTTNEDVAARLIGILVVLAIVGAIALRLNRVVENASAGDDPSFVAVVTTFFSRTGIMQAIFNLIDGAFLVVSMLVSMTLAGCAVYFFLQFRKIRMRQKEEIRLLESKLTADASGAKNERWERIEAMVSSENPGEWRAAIIDADIMLHELMRSMGHHGDTLGEMLKTVEKSDFETLDLAWEAHKVRNRIAHHGSDFILTNREAKRIIDLFRQVFQEFDVI